MNTAGFTGLDGATFTNASNAAAISLSLPLEDRVAKGLSAGRILGDVTQRLGAIEEGFIITVPPPPVRGIGNAGGFKMMIQDRGGQGLQALEEAATHIMIAGNQAAGLAGVFTLFNTSTPKLFAEIDRVRAQMFHVPAERVFQTLEVYMGSTFINDFNFLNRTFRVTAQAMGEFRQNAAAIANFKTRNDLGEMVPIGAVATVKDVSGPIELRDTTCSRRRNTGELRARLPGRPQLDDDGTTRGRVPPQGFGYGWTELAYQERLPATPACSRSSRRWCSCSCCWRRSTRAGCSRCLSS